MFENKYPYTDFHELNIDALAKEVADAKNISETSAKVYEELSKSQADVINKMNALATDVERISQNEQITATSVDILTQGFNRHNGLINEIKQVTDGLSIYRNELWYSDGDVDRKVSANYNHSDLSHINIDNITDLYNYLKAGDIFTTYISANQANALGFTPPTGINYATYEMVKYLSPAETTSYCIITCRTVTTGTLSCYFARVTSSGVGSWTQI